MRAARDCKASLTSEDKALVAADGWPEKLDEAALQNFYNNPVMRTRGEGPHVSKRHWSSIAGDEFMRMEKERINTAVKVIVNEHGEDPSLKNPAAKVALQKRIGWKMFKALPKAQRVALAPTVTQAQADRIHDDWISRKQNAFAKQIEKQKKKRNATKSVSRLGDAECVIGSPMKKAKVFHDEMMLDTMLETPEKKKGRTLTRIRRMAALGNGLIKAVKTVMDDKDSKIRNASKQIFAKAIVESGPTVRKAVTKLLPASKTWSANPKQPGRPCGSYAVSDGALTEMIDEYTNDTSLFCRKLDKPFKSLLGTKGFVRRCLAKNPNVKHKVSKKTQFNKRLRRGRLGITKSIRRVDVCQVCRVFVFKVAKQLEEDLKTAENVLGGLCHKFWDGFELHQECRAQQPKFLQDLASHIDDHIVGCPSCPALAEATTLHEKFLNDWAPKVHHWTNHWWLNAQLRTHCQYQLDHPEPGRTDIVHDFKDLQPASRGEGRGTGRGGARVGRGGKWVPTKNTGPGTLC